MTQTMLETKWIERISMEDINSSYHVCVGLEESLT